MYNPAVYFMYVRKRFYMTLLAFFFQCQQNYDEKAVDIFKRYFGGWPLNECEAYVVDHLSRSKQDCDSNCPLW